MDRYADINCDDEDISLPAATPLIIRVSNCTYMLLLLFGGAIMDRYADINCDDSDDEDLSLPAATPLIIRVSNCSYMLLLLTWWCCNGQIC